MQGGVWSRRVSDKNCNTGSPGTSACVHLSVCVTWLLLTRPHTCFHRPIDLGCRSSLRAPRLGAWPWAFRVPLSAVNYNQFLIRITEILFHIVSRESIFSGYSSMPPWLFRYFATNQRKGGHPFSSGQHHCYNTCVLPGVDVGRVNHNFWRHSYAYGGFPKTSAANLNSDTSALHQDCVDYVRFWLTGPMHMCVRYCKRHVWA